VAPELHFRVGKKPSILKLIFTLWDFSLCLRRGGGFTFRAVENLCSSAALLQEKAGGKEVFGNVYLRHSK